MSKPKQAYRYALSVYMSARPLPIKASDMGIDTRKSISTTLYLPSPLALYTLYNRWADK